MNTTPKSNLIGRKNYMKILPDIKMCQTIVSLLNIILAIFHVYTLPRAVKFLGNWETFYRNSGNESFLYAQDSELGIFTKC